MEKNTLFPIFLKTEKLNVLIVGGGKVAEEKLHFMLKSSPYSNVKMVSIDFSDNIKKLTFERNIEIVKKPYDKSDLDNLHLVIAATNNLEVNKKIHKEARKRKLLVNVADTPHLCDFYLGGVVTKGNIKIAISTNGKSPTLAKRLRQFLEDVIPDSIDDVAETLNSYRKQIKGDFENKVIELNRITKGLLSKN